MMQCMHGYGKLQSGYDYKINIHTVTQTHTFMHKHTHKAHLRAYTLARIHTYKYILT